MNFENEIWPTLGAIVLAIVGVAALAVFLSPNSKTANIVTAAGNALQGSLGAAEAPVLGSSYSFPNTETSGSEYS